MSTPLWRRVARAIRRAPERLLHRSRHARALRLVRALEGPQRIFFVCLGNICRSPYAHYRAADLLAGTAHSVASGGFVGPGRPSPQDAQDVARERGVDLAAHVSGPVTEAVLRDSTLVLVMDSAQADRVRRLLAGHPAHVIQLGDLDPLSIRTRTVLDPWKRPVAEYRDCYARIDRCVQTLVAALPAHG